MTNNNFHTIVIGAGSGGLTAAIGLAGLGKQVALVEAHHVGGDCTNAGCIPSKTLIHLARHFQKGDDPDEVFSQVVRKRNALRDQETQEVQQIENLTFIQGLARFSSPKSLIIDHGDQTRQISADNIIIATGSRARWLEIPGLPQERTLTNANFFELTEAPKHLVIAGAGIIALEMAFALNKLGTKITMFALDNRPVANAILEVSQAIQAALDRAGIRTFYQTTAKSYDESNQSLLLQQGHQFITIPEVDQVLIAIGRVPNLEALNLEQAGVRVDPSIGVVVNTFGETKVKGIYAIGDITPTSAYTHSANAQGRRVVQRIAFPLLPLSRKEPLIPNATFSDPEIASVGLTQEALAKTWHPDLIKRIRVDFKTDTDRGYTDGVENGFIIVDAVRLTGRILHVTILGPRASEMISFFTLAINQRMSLYQLFRLVYPYPTYSSGILKVADLFIKETLTQIGKEFLAYLKYRLANPG